MYYFRKNCDFGLKNLELTDCFIKIYIFVANSVNLLTEI
jgi:hypothetical protein